MHVRRAGGTRGSPHVQPAARELCQVGASARRVRPGCSLVITLGVWLGFSCTHRPPEPAGTSTSAQRSGATTMTLDDLLQRASGSDFTAYDPTAVIEAVN